MSPYPNLSLVQLSANSRITIALGLSILLFFFLPGNMLLITRGLLSWVTFGVIILFLCWFVFIKAHPKDLHIISKKQDSGKTILFLIVLAGSSASLLAVILLLGSMKNLSQVEQGKHLILAALSVFISWILVHTSFTMRYAHLFYGTEYPLGKSNGFKFPEENEPDYWDFAYLAFVIGMTFQVSDVQITGRSVRKWILIHGILSFGFNTIVIALTINTLSGLL